MAGLPGYAPTQTDAQALAASHQQAAQAGLAANGVNPAQLRQTSVPDVYVENGNNFVNAGALQAAGLPLPQAPAPTPPPTLVTTKEVIQHHVQNALALHAARAVAQAQARAAQPPAPATHAPVSTGLQEAKHDIASAVLGGVGGLVGTLGDATGWKAAQDFAHNLIGASLQSGQQADREGAALQQAHGLGADAGQLIGGIAPYALGPEVAALTYGMNAARQGAQNGDSFTRSLAGAGLQTAGALVGGGPEESVVRDALANTLKGGLLHAAVTGAKAGAAGGALQGAGSAVTQDQGFVPGAETALEGMAQGAALGAGANTLLHGVGSRLHPVRAQPPKAGTAETQAAEPEAQPANAESRPNPEDVVAKLTELLEKVKPQAETKPVAAPEPEPPVPAPVSGAAVEAANAAAPQKISEIPADLLDAVKNAQSQNPLADALQSGVELEPAASPTLPAALAKASPRFGKTQLNFASDLDRAAYIIGNPKLKSKADGAYTKFVQDALGTDEAGARAYGAQVRTAIKNMAHQNGGTFDVPDLRDDLSSSPGSQVTAPAAEVATQTAGAADKPASEPVVTPTAVASENKEAPQLVGDDAQQLQMAEDSPNARVADAAKKLQSLASKSRTGHATVPELKAALPGGSDRNAVLASLVNEGHAFPVFKRNNNESVSVGLKPVPAGTPIRQLSLAQQAVLAHLEHQVTAHLESQNTREAKAQLLNRDLSSVPLSAATQGSAPTIHAPWMDKLGITPDDAQNALDALVDRGEVSHITPESLASAMGERAGNAPKASGLYLTSHDPRLTQTDVTHPTLGTARKALNPQLRALVGLRKSQLEAMAENAPDPELRNAAQEAVNRINPGGDALNQAQTLNDDAVLENQSEPIRKPVDLHESAPLPVENADASDLSTEPEDREEPIPEPADDKKESRAALNAAAQAAHAQVQHMQRRLDAAKADPNATPDLIAKRQRALEKAQADMEWLKSPAFARVASAAAGHGMFAPEFWQHLQELSDHMFGPGVVPVEHGERANAAGFTDLDKIHLTAHALTMHPESVLTHEAAHIVRERYLTPKERQLADQSLKPGTARYKRLSTWATKRKIPRDKWDVPEERFSYYAEAVHRGDLPKPTGLLGRLYAKLSGVLDRAHNWLLDRGYRNTDDILAAMHRGDFAQREPRMGAGSAMMRVAHESNATNLLRREITPSDIGDQQLGYKLAEHPDLQMDKIQKVLHGTAGVAHAAYLRRLAMSIPSVQAHLRPLFRPLFRAWEARYRTGREVEAKVAHAAPMWFDPTLRSALGNRAARKAATKILSKGDQEKTVYTPAGLRAKFKADDKTVQAYQQARAAMNAINDSTRERLGDEFARVMQGVSKAADSLAPKLASEGPAKDRAYQHLLDLKATAEKAAADYKSSLTKLDRLQQEGYIPHYRDGRVLAHLRMKLPTGYAKLVEAKQALAQESSAAAEALKQGKLTKAAQKKALESLKAHQAAITALQQSVDDAAARGDFGDSFHYATIGHSNFHSAKKDAEARIAALKAHPEQLGEFAPYVDHLEHEIYTKQDSMTQDAVGMEKIQRVLDGLDERGVALTPEQRVALLREVVEANSGGFNKYIARQDIGGEDQDIHRALAHAAVFAGEQLGAHRTAGARMKAMQEILRSQDPSAQYLAEAYERGLAGGNAMQLGAEHALRNLTGLGMLGYNLHAPMYALQNIPFAIANLARNEKPAIAATRYAKALKDTAVTVPQLQRAAAAKRSLGGLSKEEVQRLWAAHERGDVAPQFANTVLGAHGGKTLLGSALVHNALLPLAATENHLRMGTYLAALRQHAALSRTGNAPLGLDLDAAGSRLPEANAEQYARDIATLSNQNYQREDTIPALGQTGDLRTVFQFATPQLRIIGMLHHLAKTNPAILSSLLAGAGVLGGYQALPLAQDAESGYNALSGWMAAHGLHAGWGGDDEGLETHINQALNQTLPAPLAKATAYGALHDLGGADLSEFAGVANNPGNNLIQLVGDAFTPGLNLTHADIAVPATALVTGLAKAYQAATHGRYGEAVRALPIPLVQELRRAVEVADQGRVKTVSGKTAADVPSTIKNVLLQALGVPLTREQDMYDYMDQTGYEKAVRNVVGRQVEDDLQQGVINHNPGLMQLARKLELGYNAHAKTGPLPLPDYGKIIQMGMLSRLNPEERMRMSILSAQGLPFVAQAAQ